VRARPPSFGAMATQDGGLGDEDIEERPSFDTNADILPSKRVKAPKEEDPEKDEKMSKRKKRKLEQLAQKRAGQEMRAEVLAGLKSVQLSQAHSNLLRSSQSTRTSRRQEIALAKQRVALGIPLTEEQRKLRRKRPKAAEEDEPSDADDAGPAGGSTASASSGRPARAPKAMSVAAEGAVALARERSKEKAQAAVVAAAAAVAAAKAAALAAEEGAWAASGKAEEFAAAAAKEQASFGNNFSPQPLQRMTVQRLQAIEAQREKLPAVMMEQEVIEMALSTDVMLVCGETGCGKSTQVPQFLYEAGFCGEGGQLIGVTQPRRVAAISVSQRVGEELNSPGTVGYQVRYDKSNCSRDARIKFMTDGILLREVQADFLCKKYAAIIIDEAHERGVNCDILIGLLSRAVLRRRKDFEAAVAAGLYEKAKDGGAQGSPSTPLPPPPLKLVIMSATLRVCDFTENTMLFPSPPPVLRIEARTFPVTAHFARRTDDDYIKAAMGTVMKIHQKLPPGTILVFVTGRNEVHRLVKLLNQNRKIQKPKDDEAEDSEAEEEEEDEDDANNFERLEASDDEGGEFDDDLATCAEAKQGEADLEQAEPGDSTQRKQGKRKKKGEEVEDLQAQDEVAAPADSSAPASTESVATKKVPTKKVKGKTNQGKEENADAAQSDESAQNSNKPTGQAQAAAAPAEAPSSAPKKKKRRKEGKAGTIVATEGEAATPEAGEEKDSDEIEVDFGMGEDEDVVVLDPEAAEDKKDSALAHAKKVNMVKLDKSRTAGGVFKGIGFGEGPIRAMPLYAQLPSSMQLAPFGAPPEGYRVVVVSTNVAETSVTLPNVRYVVDTGHEKRRQYRASSGISAFAIDRISKASADQRAGRAGRLGPGHTYRLYSAALYENHFHQFAPIPILHTPMDPVLLLIAFLGVPRLDVFPWPTPPSSESVTAAIRRLRALGAINDDGNSAESAGKSAVRCTKLGFRLAALPVAPRYGKMLLSAIAASQDMENGIIGHMCAIVAALSVGNLTAWETLSNLPDEDDKQKTASGEHELERARREARQRLLDAPKKDDAPRWSTLRDDSEGLLWLMGGYAWAVRSGDEVAEAFCRANRVNGRNIGEAHSLMQQLGALLKRRLSLDALGKALELPLQLKPPTPAQALKLRECIVDGLMDRVAVQCPDLGPYAYLCGDVGRETPVFIHTSSNAHRYRPRPTVLVFNEIIATTKPCMRDCIAVDSTVLARRATAGDCPLLQIGDFLPVPAPRYLRDQDTVMAFCSPIYAPLGYKLPTIEISVPSDMIFRYKVFAKALLEGEVIDGFPPKGARLLAQPGLVLHAPTNSRVSSIVSPLWGSRVGSRAELAKKWTEEPRFLLEGLLKWLPASLHDEICVNWPPNLSGKQRS